ncbi:hypothetical protein [Fimbriiglobus ruber]|nr:hypothetical protein [Fimbriiglobus ruber]
MFRTSLACRKFMDRFGHEIPRHFYPLFPDEKEFVGLLSVAMRDAAEGYVLVDEGRWCVIGFNGTLSPRTIEAPSLACSA